MKALFVIKALHEIKGGAERVFADVTSGLAGRGHDICALTFDASGAAPFYKVAPGVRAINLGIGRPQEKARIFETLRRVSALRDAIRRERPDIVVAFMHSMFVPTAIAAIGLGVPVVGSEHIVPDHYKTRRIEFWLFLACSFLLRKITVLSDTIRNSYPAIIRRKMVVVPNPVNVPATIDLGKSETRTILNVGRLDPQKDQETLIRAFAKLAAKYQGWLLKIYGEGKLRGELAALIDSLGLFKRVYLCGTTPDIGTVYESADIFALSSCYESFGLATAEAMAHGLPVIGFAECKGTQELIADGKNGILVHGPDRITAMAAGLERLMNSPEMRRMLGINGRETAARYTLSSVVDRWTSILEREIKKSSP